MTNEEPPKHCPFPFKDFIILVMQQDYETIRPLLESKDFDVNTEDFRGVNVLHYAAEFGDFEMIKMIFKYQPRAKINAMTLKTMLTPLMSAAMFGKVNALEALLNYGADTSCQNASGFTALMLAAEGGHEKCVNILLKRGRCDIKIQSFSGVNALMLSVNFFDIAKKLIKDSDISQVDISGATVLHWTCKNAPVSVLNLLLAEPGIAINHKDFDGATPLHFAIQNHRLDMARILIENGANLVAKNSHGLSLFHYAIIYDRTEEFLREFACEESEVNDTFVMAAYYGRLETLKSLIPKLNTEFIDNALISAAKGGHLECMKFLVEADNYDPSSDSFVDAAIASLSENKFVCFEYLYSLVINGPENFKNECLLRRDQFISTAFSYGCLEACELFLANGLEPNGSDPVTFLMAASGNGHLEVVNLLLEHGADIDRKHENMGSALLLAVINNHLEIVKRLLEKGADTSSSDEKGFTPLLSAAFYGHSEVFYELFQANRNFQECTKDGLTTLLAACISGRLEIVEALVKHGAKMDEIDVLGNNCLHFAAESATNMALLIYLVQRVDNLVRMITSPNKDGKTPLDLLLSHQNHSLLISVLIAEPEIEDLIESPCKFELEIIENHDMCLICRDDFVVGDVVTKLPCRHLFHGACYCEWSVTKPNCPYCQRFPFKIKK